MSLDWSEVMKFIKEHKFYFIGGAVLLLVIVVGIFAFSNIIFPNSGESVYGDRLGGIENVKIESDLITRIEQEFKEKEQVNEISYRLSGRIMNFMIDVKKDTKLEDAQSLAEELLTYFSEEEQKFYDIQVYLTCKEAEESEVYPMIGYKHKTSDVFQWNYYGE